MELKESQNGVCIRILVANISGCSDWVRAVSRLFDSPCLGLYRQKERPQRGQDLNNLITGYGDICD